MQDLAAQNSCWMTLSACRSLIKMYSHSLRLKIYIIIDCLHPPLQQRRKTSEENAFFTQEWRSVSRCRRVKIGLHSFDISWFQSPNQWNLLLWLASATEGLPVIRQVLDEFRNSAPVYGSRWFSDTDISQGSVATHLRCDDCFIANFLESVPV